MAVDGRAVLIRGASGSGKSALALEMMARGAHLVADDRVVLSTTEHGIALSAPDPIRGLIEARGVGILHAKVVCGARLFVVVDLDHLETERLPQRRKISLLGHSLPLLHKVDTAYFPASLVQYLRAERRE
ncbi:HPr kinase/phosphorylase [Puniceibacterium sp. IMCC21224]|uniref:HPr kinase/phosphorylase n=1 Tax=Puniceibacterium sp. IMCC21224 TaxID=1618204 RepID=UPI0035109121